MLDSHDAGHKVGHYTAGWIKRGPSGVIGTNKKDALETVQHLLADVESGTLLEPRDPAPEAIEELLAERGVRYVTFEDWQAIDQAEVGRGEPHGRPRVKFVRVEEMLDTLGERRAAEADGASTSAELQAMIEAALPGADGRGGRRRRRRPAPARRRHRPPVRGPLADRPAPAGQGGGQTALRRRHGPRALGEDQRPPERSRAAPPVPLPRRAKKLHFRAPHLRFFSLALEPWRQCARPGPIRGSTT